MTSSDLSWDDVSASIHALPAMAKEVATDWARLRARAMLRDSRAYWLRAHREMERARR